MEATKREIIVGVEEKDRAIGRTLKRSLSQSGHSRAHAAVDDVTVGLVVASQGLATHAIMRN